MVRSVDAALLYGAVAASATFTGNMNYHSPSLHHPALGVSIHKDAAKLNFTHGIASGDPYDDSVILWTRVAPIGSDNDQSNVTVSGHVALYDHDNEAYVAKSDSPVCVDWKIGTSEKLKGKAVDSGRALTSSDVDWTVKVEAKRLKSFTTYYYQFSVCDSTNVSPIGRTKTIPSAKDKVTSAIKLAIYSCSNFPFGFFNAYGNAVRKDSVNYVVHLGDYIYEYGNGEYGWGDSMGRIPLPNKQIYSLYDYRKRIATYRTDLDLVASHQNFPWIPVWDNHEVSDNTYRDGASGLNNTEESFVRDGGISVDQRKMNAVRAYFEWMPIRQVDMDDNLRIWRQFSFGDLFDLLMLDTRQYDRSITDLSWNTDYIAEIAQDAGRSLMGPRQEAWFYNRLRDSRVNESAALGDATPFNGDAWDGYQANRNRTFATLYDNKINNTIFLAGDSHASWVSDLVWLGEHDYDAATGAGSIGVEFAGSAVSSPCPFGQNISMAAAGVASAWLTGANPELQWQDLYYRGYYELSIDYASINASFFGVPTNRIRQGYEVSLANFTVLNGENALHRSSAGSGAAAAAALGGVVESGSLKQGQVRQTNLTLDTATGEYLFYNGAY
ncbi:hypothetical protein PG988_005248 [Apiospora saccharicola]